PRARRVRAALRRHLGLGARRDRRSLQGDRRVRDRRAERPTIARRGRVLMELQPILRLSVDVRPPITAGETPHGEIRVLPFEGGTFETLPADGSEPIRGTVADGGTD